MKTNLFDGTVEAFHSLGMAARKARISIQEFSQCIPSEEENEIPVGSVKGPSGPKGRNRPKAPPRFDGKGETTPKAPPRFDGKGAA